MQIGVQVMRNNGQCGANGERDWLLVGAFRLHNALYMGWVVVCGALTVLGCFLKKFNIPFDVARRQHTHTRKTKPVRDLLSFANDLDVLSFSSEAEKRSNKIELVFHAIFSMRESSSSFFLPL